MPVNLSPSQPEPDPRSSTSSIFGSVATLPRGPHRLTRKQVAGSQRARLLGAIAELVVEKGYVNATITETARRAGVSPNVFYEHFDDKEECFLAAYDAFTEALLARMTSALDPEADWHQFITSTLDAYVGTLEENPVLARAFMLEIDATGEAGRRRRRRAWEQFAALLKARHELIRRQDLTLGPLPDRIYLAIGQGVRALVCDALEDDPKARLREITPDARLWITATIQGAAAAGAELA